MPFHLDTFRRGAWGHGPGSGGATVEAQWSDLTWVEVAQFPWSPIHLFGLEVGPLITEFITVAEQPLRFLVFCLWLYLKRLSVLIGQAVLCLLDFLVQCFAQFSAQVSVRQASLAASLWTGTLFLCLTSTLTAGSSLWRAAMRLVTVSNWCFTGEI